MRLFLSVCFCYAVRKVSHAVHENWQGLHVKLLWVRLYVKKSCVTLYATGIQRILDIWSLKFQPREYIILNMVSNYIYETVD